MHKFLRAVGFSQYTEKKQVQKLIRDIIIHADERSYTTVGKKTLVAEFDRNFAEDIGIAVCGEFDEDDTYSFDYYLPYLRSDLVSTAEDISIERHAAKESYAGICDDPKVGVSLIFYLQNMISYLKLQGEGKIPAKGTSLNLSALSCQGTIMMPIQKTEWQKKKIAKDAVQRNRLIQAARGGDEEAMESLTLEDMDTYTSISRKIQKHPAGTFAWVLAAGCSVCIHFLFFSARLRSSSFAPAYNRKYTVRIITTTILLSFRLKKEVTLTAARNSSSDTLRSIFSFLSASTIPAAARTRRTAILAIRFAILTPPYCFRKVISPVLSSIPSTMARDSR